MFTLINMWLKLRIVHGLKTSLNCTWLQWNLCNHAEDDTALRSVEDEFISPSESKSEEHSCPQSGIKLCLMSFVPVQHLLIKITAQIERWLVCSEAGKTGLLCMGVDILNKVLMHWITWICSYICIYTWIPEYTHMPTQVCARCWANAYMGLIILQHDYTVVLIQFFLIKMKGHMRRTDCSLFIDCNSK